MSKFVAFTPEQFRNLDDRLSEIEGYALIACDDITYNNLSRATLQGVIVIRQTPAEMSITDSWLKNNVRLCWFKNMVIEIAQPQFVATPNSGGGFTITCIAKGISSTVSGALGIDDEWTVAA